MGGLLLANIGLSSTFLVAAAIPVAVAIMALAFVKEPDNATGAQNKSQAQEKEAKTDTAPSGGTLREWQELMQWVP